MPCIRLHIILFFLLLWSSLPAFSAFAASDHVYPWATGWPIVSNTVDAKGSSTDLLFGLYHQRTAGSYKRYTLRPWLFNLETDPARDFRELSLAFNIVHVEHEGEEFRRHLFPLYWQGRTAKKQWFHLWPAYGKSEDVDGTRTVSFLYPLFSLTRHPETDDRTLRYFWPLGESRRTGEERSSRFLPVWWRHKTPQLSEGFFLPYLWRDDGENHTRALLPVWWRHETPQVSEGFFLPYLWRHEGESHTRAVLPLWWWQRSPEKSAGYFLTYLWRDDAESHTRAILPLWLKHRSPQTKSGYFLLYAWKEKNETRHDLVVPFLWRYRSPESRFSLLFPLYLGWEKNQSSGSVVLPLWYASHTEESDFKVLFPFYLDWRSGAENRLKLVLPLYSDHRSEASATRVVFPFYFRHSNVTFDSTLRYWFPLFGSYERGSETQRYYLFPLYAHMQDPERGYDSRFFLWPLVHHETLPDAHDTWVLPLFRHQRSAGESATMAGLLWWSGHGPERNYTLLLPLYGRWRNEAAGEYRVTPLSFEMRKPDGYRKGFFLGPLAIQTEDPQQQRQQLDILWPLISRSQRGETSHSRFLPFWWHDQSPERSLSLAPLPPYLHIEEPGQSLFHLWPFYGRRIEGDFREDAVIWPLFRYGRDSEGERRSWQALIAFGDSDTDRNRFVIFPLWYHQREGEATRNLSLLHWQERSPDARTFALLHLGNPDRSLFNLSNRPTRRHQHLFPLYGYTQTTAPESVRTWVVWPLYSYKRDDERTRHALLWRFLYRDRGPQKSETAFLWRFIRSRHNAESSIFEFNPFYYRESRADGSEYFTSWLLGSYATLTTVEKTEHRLLWFLRW